MTVQYLGWQNRGNFGDDLLFEIWKEWASLHKLDLVEIPLYKSDLPKKLLKYLISLPSRKMILLGGGTLWGYQSWYKHLRNAQLLKKNTLVFALGIGAVDCNTLDPHSTQGYSPELWMKPKTIHILGSRGYESQRIFSRYLGSTMVVGDPVLHLLKICESYRYLNIKPMETFDFGISVMGDPEDSLNLRIAENFKIAKIIEPYSKKQIVKIVSMSKIDDARCAHLASIIANSIFIQYSSPRETIEQISTLDVLISERLHASVAACAVGVIPILLAYHNKVLDFAGSLNLNPKLIIENNELSSIGLGLEYALANRESLKNQIKYSRELLFIDFKKSLADLESYINSEETKKFNVADSSAGKCIVISTFANAANAGSEPGVGWLFTKIAYEYCKLNNIRLLIIAPLPIVNELRAHFSKSKEYDNITVIGIDSPLYPKNRKSGIRLRLSYLDYIIRLRKIYQDVTRYHKPLLFHHVSYASEILPPSSLFVKSDEPKLWGPIGSAGRSDIYLLTAKSFLEVIHALTQKARDFFAPKLFQLWSRKADYVIFQTQDAKSILLGNRSNKSKNFLLSVFPNVPTALNISTRFKSAGDNDKTVFLVVGVLSNAKRADLAIEAFSSLEFKHDELRIIGEGNERIKLENRVKELGIEDRVKFTGWLSREELIEQYGQSNVLIHLSMRESASWVTAEAIQQGLIVINFTGTGASGVANYLKGKSVSINFPKNNSIFRRKKKQLSLKQYIVDAMLKSKDENNFAQQSDQQSELDKLVFGLYDLVLKRK